MLTPLLGLTKPEIQQICTQLSLPKFSATQIIEWIYRHRVSDISMMTNLSIANRNILSARYSVGIPTPITETQSSDGTKKYLFSFHGGLVESVYIPDRDRATLCVSTEVGCKMNCAFCQTGRQGYTARLSADEIIGQILGIPDFSTLTNVVFMGMGEPFDNTEAVIRALRVLTSSDYLSFSPRRITVSTVGIPNGVEFFLQNSECHLAISLHNPFSNERASIMPIERRYPIADTITLLHKYNWKGQRRLSFEYILFDKVNDTIRHAQALLHLLDGLPCRVNLIRFHSFHGSPFNPSPDETIQFFADFLNAHHLLTTIRRSRGEDILAACGMLSTQYTQLHP